MKPGVPAEEILDHYRAGLAPSQVARRLHCDPDVVNRVLDEARIRRTVGNPPRFTAEQLHQWYVAEGLSASEIARRTNTSSSGITAALHRAGIPIRHGTELTEAMLDDDTLWRLYVDQRRSDDDIAGRYGVAAWAVRRRRRAAQIFRPPGTPPWTRAIPDRVALERLYVTERRTMAEIATHHEVTQPTVRRWLTRLGIERRTAQHDTTPDPNRDPIHPDELRQAYVEEGRTAAEIAADFGVSKNIILEALHAHRVPVRPPGPSAAPPVVLLDALYADPAVTDALARHGVDQRRFGGWLRDRWPIPADLTERVLRDLYIDVGLSAQHISLLTGHTTTGVRSRLQTAGIPARSAGRSPWRANTRRD